jgi:hypothetical protein
MITSPTHDAMVYWPSEVISETTAPSTVIRQVIGVPADHPAILHELLSGVGPRVVLESGHS